LQSTALTTPLADSETVDLNSSVRFEIAKQVQYLVWPHVCHMIGRGGGSSIKTSVDKALIQRDLVRAVGVWLPSAVSSPSVVARTDFLATMPERIARQFAPPLPLPDVQIMMYWHDRTHRNPSHRWLRQVLRTRQRGLAG
jgi:DNA-binding transcriptional LysR family regulator